MLCVGGIVRCVRGEGIRHSHVINQFFINMKTANNSHICAILQRT